MEQSGRRKKRSTTDPNYLTTETQFSLSVVSTEVYNTPPRLISPTSITMEEDEGIRKNTGISVIYCILKWFRSY